VKEKWDEWEGNEAGICDICGKPVFGKEGTHYIITTDGRKQHIDCGEPVLPGIRASVYIEMIEVIGKEADAEIITSVSKCMKTLLKRDWEIFNDKQRQAIKECFMKYFGFELDL